ncbi:MAG: cytochrome C oxidase subunit IV family protein [Sulfurifustaceae bacterium]
MNTSDVPSIKTYLVVWLSLLVLLALTLTSAYVRLGTGNVVVNVAIAVIKAALVAIFFMHLKRGSVISRLVAVAGFLWLLVLIGLTLTDYLTRG